jgi:hypothetical protein
MKEIPARVRTYLPLTRALLISSAGCLLMVILRNLLIGSLRFGFLLWNLFLAWIPYYQCLFIRKIAVTGPQSRPALL